jgi:hypothetical protein
MRISIKALTFVTAVIWAGCVLFVIIVHSISVSYGGAFLGLVSSIYPGFHGSGTPGDMILGVGYALVDGAVGGAVFGWLYNGVVRTTVAG